MPPERPLPAWKVGRFKRLGIPLPEAPRLAPSQPAGEHKAALADLRAIEEAERGRDAD